MSEFNFARVAQETTLLSPIMAGKEKLSTEDVVGKNLTIVAFDFAPKFDQKGNPVVDESTGEVDTFGVVVFEELPDNYYCVGTVFTKVCKAWAAAFGDSPANASEALANQGGVKVRFQGGKTKGGNNLTTVDIIG